jgi:uncharacterized membrane protein
MQNMSGGKTALGLDSNVGALICYLGNFICGIGGLIYSILVITQDKTNKLTRFHAFQSIILSVVWFVVFIGFWVLWIAGAFVDAFIGLPIITGLMGLVFFVMGVGILVFVILAAIKAFNGEFYKIPVIGNFAEKYSS